MNRYEVTVYVTNKQSFHVSAISEEEARKTVSHYLETQDTILSDYNRLPNGDIIFPEEYLDTDDSNDWDVEEL